MTPPAISILIVSFNTRDLLRGCLRSLERVADEADAEVIVVDNASHDGSAEAVAAEFPRVRLIRAAVNLGFAAGMNQALAVASGEYLLVLNPDAVVVPGAIRTLADFLADHPRAAVAGAGLTYPDGSPQSSTFGFPTLCKEFLNFLPELKAILRPRQMGEAINRLLRRDVHELGRVRPPFRAEVVSGAAFLARAEALAQVGGFDSGFFLYHEEMDLCRRLLDAGWEVWSVPGAQVVHFDAQATGYRTGRMPSSPVLDWRIGGMDRYWAKHMRPALHQRWRCQARALLRLRLWANGWGGEGRRQRRAELRGVIQRLKSPSERPAPLHAA